MAATVAPALDAVAAIPIDHSDHHHHRTFDQHGDVSFIDHPEEKIKDVEEEQDAEQLTESDSEIDEYERCDCLEDSARISVIPYSAIYDTIEEEARRGYFIPSKPVKATIVSAHRDTDRAIHLFNPYMYTIELEHGPFKWTIERKFTDFQKLHNHLLVFRTTEKLKAPVRRMRHHKAEAPKTVTSLPYCKHDGLYETTYGQCRDPVATRNYFGDANFDSIPPPSPVDLGQEKKKPKGAGAGATIVSPGSPPPGAVITASPENGGASNNGGRKKSNGAHKKAHKMPKFPLLPDSLIGPDDIDTRRDELQHYLTGILHLPSLRNHKETAGFLDVSRLSFVHNLGRKWKEGLVKKRPGGRLDFRSVRRYCAEHCGKWNRRWLVVKDSFIAYVHPGTNYIREVLLFDSDFSVRAGGRKTEGVKKGLAISNLNRELVVKCESDRIADDWKQQIETVLEQHGKTWTETNRFGSTFPIRGQSYAQWFVDGATFMEHAANMMELAKEEIFITDWWLTPEVYMKRPAKKGDKWQLMEILKRKAEQGVHVFILLYKELEIALGIGSAYAKRVLMGLNPKILVMRHPEHIPVPWMWAHHEKCIVIDQNIAFVGGIDLCYGRWDDHSHKLIDLGQPFMHTVESMGSVKPRTIITEIKEMTEALEDEDVVDSKLRAQREKDIVAAASGGDPEQTVAAAAAAGADQSGDSSKRKISRWRSIAKRVGRNKSAERGGGVQRQPTLPRMAEVVRKYQEYLESDKMQKIKMKENTPPMTRRRKITTALDKWKHRLKRDSVDDGIYNEYEKMLSQIEKNQDQYEKDAQGNLWIGKDYVNFIFKDVVGLELPYCDLVDRKAIPRMPWHDISSVVYGSAARDVARHFIQRWNACKVEKLKYVDIYPFLVPKSYDNVQIPNVFRKISHRCTAQILRSGRNWSCGINTVEESIHQAYIHMISTAKHYIYIENQFFVSLIGSNHVKNHIAQALFDRIVKAHKQNEKFRVFILMPLLPAFEGKLGDPSGAPLQTVLYWTYNAISKGPHSLLVNLENAIGDYSKYVKFYSLRTHTELCGRLVSELLYIHSKLIIVDDTSALIGSANINDRSQLGERDSEVALFVEDNDFLDTRMNNQPYKAGKFAYTLRQQLFGEHLGLLDESGQLLDDTSHVIDLTDPVCDEFYDKFQHIARHNTATFDMIFKCYPSDEIRTWADLERYRSLAMDKAPAVTNRHEAEQAIATIQGYLVEFPTKFLIDESLAPQILSKEGLAPVMLFT